MLNEIIDFAKSYDSVSWDFYIDPCWSLGVLALNDAVGLRLFYPPPNPQFW
jgi:hypothetical protein